MKARQYMTWLSGSALAGLTQVLGLSQITLLLVSSGAGAATDAYFLMAVWTQVPVQVVLLGLMYPIWLRNATVRSREIRAFLLLTPTLSMLAALVAAMWFRHVSGDYPQLLQHATLFAAIGVISSAVWAGAVRLSASGDPRWLASVTLVPNLIATICLVFAVRESPTDKVGILLTAQLAGWLLAATGLVGFNRQLLRRIWKNDSGNATSLGQGRSNYWFLTQSLAGYGSNVALQSQAAALPANALSVLGVLSRVLAGFNALVTNALLPRLIHSDSSDSNGVYRFARIAAVGSGIGVLLAGLAGWVSGQNFVLGSAVIFGWFAGSSLNAAMKKVAVRELHPRIAWVSSVANLAMPLCVGVLAAFGHQSLIVILCACVGLDLLPGVLLALILGRTKLALVSTVVSVAGVSIGAIALADGASLF